MYILTVLSSYTAKKPVKSKEELNFEKKRELEKRLLDVNGQLNPKKQNAKRNGLFYCSAFQKQGEGV